MDLSEVHKEPNAPTKKERIKTQKMRPHLVPSPRPPNGSQPCLENPREKRQRLAPRVPQTVDSYPIDNQIPPAIPEKSQHGGGTPPISHPVVHECYLWTAY